MAAIPNCGDFTYADTTSAYVVYSNTCTASNSYTIAWNELPRSSDGRFHQDAKAVILWERVLAERRLWSERARRPSVPQQASPQIRIRFVPHTWNSRKQLARQKRRARLQSLS